MNSFGFFQKWELYLKYASARQYLLACFQGKKDYNEEKYNKYKEIFILYRKIAKDRGQYPETLEEFLLQCEEYEQSITPAVIKAIAFKKQEELRIREEKKKRTLERKIQRQQAKKQRKNWIKEAMKSVLLYEDCTEALEECVEPETKTVKPRSRIVYDKKGNPQPKYLEYRIAVQESESVKVSNFKRI